MSSSSKKSGKGKFWQKAILFCGGGAFLLTAVLPIIGSFFNGSSHNGNPQQGARPQIATEELQELESNLLLVLEREPNNPNALQNLVQVRLELGDLPGAIDPLDKLISLFPEDQVLVQLKEQVEENIIRTNPAALPTDDGESPTPEADTPVTDEVDESTADPEAEAEAPATDGIEESSDTPEAETESVPETEPEPETPPADE